MPTQRKRFAPSLIDWVFITRTEGLMSPVAAGVCLSYSGWDEKSFLGGLRPELSPGVYLFLFAIQGFKQADQQL